MSSLDFWGSTLVMKAESKEKVLETLKADPYTKSDVWDWDKVSTAQEKERRCVTSILTTSPVANLPFQARLEGHGIDVGGPT